MEDAAAFPTLERASLALAIDQYAKARAGADASAQRVRMALRAVALSEGGKDADPALWAALLAVRAA